MSPQGCCKDNVWRLNTKVGRAGPWRQNTTSSYHRIQGSSRLSSWMRVKGSSRGCDGSGGVNDIVLTRDDISSSGGVSKPLRLLLSPENALGSLKRLYERPKPNSCASSMRHLRAICCNRSHGAPELVGIHDVPFVDRSECSTAEISQGQSRRPEDEMRLLKGLLRPHHPPTD